MAKLLYVYIFAVFCIAGSLQSFPFTNCDNEPAPTDLRIDGCSVPPCSFKRGTNLTAQWDFVMTSNTKTLTPRVKATVLGVTINYPFEQTDACKSLINAECPLEEGDIVTFDLNMPISKRYPSIKLIVEFALIDEHKNAQVCFKIQAQVA
ncbi:NPC intracellular cholesterol transporter 2-like [Prorops nasuta]|uniref:NPC intracellular cholesterol transporter 2-like n=1 Tax=Prorops nasuta TaxID=863751 RepID=UPI0034CECF57